MSFIKRSYLLGKRFVFLAQNSRRFVQQYWHASQQLKKRFQNKVVGLMPVHAIGPMVLFFDRHMRHFRAHHIDEQRDVALVSQSSPCNVQLDKMIRRTANIVADDVLYHCLSGGGAPLLRRQGELTASVFKNGPTFFRESPAPLAFTAEEIDYGYHLLRKLGADPDKPIVTINSKDNEYWKSRGEDKEWDHYRNTDFSDLHRSVSYLIEEGMQVVRTGFYHEFGPTPYHNLNVLSKDEVDFMDIFLPSKAVLSINGDSGIAWLPYLFRKPVLIHNFIPMGESPPVEYGIFIPKLMRKKGATRLMTLKEIQDVKHLMGLVEGPCYNIVAISADRFQGIYYYKKHGIEVIDNTVDEVLEGVKEALQYSQGNLRLTVKDQVLQDQFKRSFPLGHPMRHTPGLVSPSFLKKHAAIL